MSDVASRQSANDAIVIGSGPNGLAATKSSAAWIPTAGEADLIVESDISIC